MAPGPCCDDQAASHEGVGPKEPTWTPAFVAASRLAAGMWRAALSDEANDR